MVPNAMVPNAMVPNGTRWFSMILNGTQLYQMVPNGYQWYQMVPNDTKWYLMVTNRYQWYHTSDVFVPIDWATLANQNISTTWKLTHLVVPRTCFLLTSYHSSKKRNLQ